MRFFEHQRIAKKKTSILFRTFILLVLVISFGTGLSISLLIKMNHFENDLIGSLFFSISFITLFIILGVTWFKTYKLKENPASICRSLGAKKCLGLKEKNYLQYINIIEEMSIASGVPMPEIFILEDPAINAFACGFDINSAAICVTTGALDSFNRDELQAVVGHEFSHILNGDMNLNLRLIGMISGLVFIYEIGYHLSVGNRRTRRSSRKSGGGQVGLIIMALGGIGWLAGSWLKSKISVQREFLADASSVQFTRNPNSLISAFEKIMMNEKRQILDSPKATSFSHMFFSSGVKSFLSFKTHPPIIDRIKRIDQNYVLGQNGKKRKISTKETKTGSHKEMTDVMKNSILVGVLTNLERSSDLNIKKILSQLLRGEDKFKNISSEELLKVLQVIFSLITNLDKAQRTEIENMVKEEVYNDDKILFNEFIIMAYLRPAFKNIPIHFKCYTQKDLKSEISEFSQFVLKVSRLGEVPNDLNLKVLNVIAPIKLSYRALFSVFDKLRFASPDLKKDIIADLELIFRYDNEITSREYLLFKLVCQILGVPSGESIQKS